MGVTDQILSQSNQPVKARKRNRLANSKQQTEELLIPFPQSGLALEPNGTLIVQSSSQVSDLWGAFLL